MLVNIITETSCDDIIAVINQIESDQVVADNIDVYELRIDYIKNIDNSVIDKLVNIKTIITKPVIFTLRAKRDGGKFEHSEQERLLLLSQLADLEPDYLDIEDYIDNDYIVKLKTSNPSVKIIRSYHNYHNSTSELNLCEILTNMQHSDCSIYKISTNAKLAVDCLSILDFLRKYNKHNNIVAHCMGALGSPSRVLGKIYNSYFTYCYYEHDFASNSDQMVQIAPGLLSIQELLFTYNYRSINNHTRIYALLGHPVDHSVGHLYHNENFKTRKINAVYVKLDIPVKQFDQFMDKLVDLKYLAFAGFSVTMPHKNNIIKFIQPNYDPEYDAINTVKIDNGNLCGINTDGEGCVQAIEVNGDLYISQKRVLILGAGGSASAIILAIARNGGICTIINRTIEKAKAISNKYGFDFFV